MNMHNSTITPRNLSPAELQEIVRKVHALRAVSKTTGFNTLNTIVALLRPLSTEDLIAVGEELKLKPREMPQTTTTDEKRQQPIYDRGNK
jgi:hypothetical protein